MLKKLLLCVLICTLFTVPSAAETLNRIAAVVNDDIITTHQLQQRLKDAGVDNNSQQQQQMLDAMIAELLMQQRAKDIGIEVSADDIDQALSDVENKNNITRDQLEQALLAQGLTMERYREQLSAQILRYKLMGHEVQSKVDITRQEIRNYYQQHLDEFRQSAHSRISRISFPLGDDNAQQNAQIALRKLSEGKSVDTILEEMSGRSQVEGGDMGAFKPGELSPAFEQAISTLNSGEHSEIIELGGSLHILKVEDKTSGGVADLASVEEDIRQQLRQEKLDQKLEQWRTKLKGEAYIDIRL
ncbi:MAG: peptidyl-prolyl cis-trans isomerase [Desulfuromonas sp.]|nr:peptidyl-prolyl cis-trans isomerase [Desulfuromonas sp.]